MVDGIAHSLESIFTSDRDQQVQPVDGQLYVRTGHMFPCAYWNFGAQSSWPEKKRMGVKEAIRDIIYDEQGCSNGIMSKAFVTVDNGTHEDGLRGDWVIG